MGPVSGHAQVMPGMSVHEADVIMTMAKRRHYIRISSRSAPTTPMLDVIGIRSLLRALCVISLDQVNA